MNKFWYYLVVGFFVEQQQQQKTRFCVGLFLKINKIKLDNFYVQYDI